MATHFDKGLFCEGFDCIPEYAGVPNSHCCLWTYSRLNSTDHMLSDHLSHIYTSRPQANRKLHQWHTMKSPCILAVGRPSQQTSVTESPRTQFLRWHALIRWTLGIPHHPLQKALGALRKFSGRNTYNAQIRMTERSMHF